MGGIVGACLCLQSGWRLKDSDFLVFLQALSWVLTGYLGFDPLPNGRCPTGGLDSKSSFGKDPDLFLCPNLFEWGWTPDF